MTTANENVIRDLAHQTSVGEIDSPEIERAITYGDNRMYAATGQSTWTASDGQYQNAITLASTYGAFYVLMMQNEVDGAKLLIQDAERLLTLILNAPPDAGEKSAKKKIAISSYRSYYFDTENNKPWSDTR